MRSRLLVVLFTVFGLFWSLQLWAEDSPKVADAPAELKVANRSVVVFRATLLGEAPASRVKRAKTVIGEALDDADDLDADPERVELVAKALAEVIVLVAAALVVEAEPEFFAVPGQLDLERLAGGPALVQRRPLRLEQQGKGVARL